MLPVTDFEANSKPSDHANEIASAPPEIAAEIAASSRRRGGAPATAAGSANGTEDDHQVRDADLIREDERQLFPVPVVTVQLCGKAAYSALLKRTYRCIEQQSYLD